MGPVLIVLVHSFLCTRRNYASGFSAHFKMGNFTIFIFVIIEAGCLNVIEKSDSSENVLTRF